jgi:hypothetical protein
MIMNKTNMLVLAGLILFSAHSAFTMGKQEREILYTLHELGQNIADVPMITQNIDMFIGVLEMNIQITEARLAAANEKFKKTLWKNAALFGGCQVGKAIFITAMEKIKDSVSWRLRQTNSFAVPYTILWNSVHGIAFMAGSMFVTLHIYDEWKNISAFNESLALDRQILWQLIEIKDSMDQSAESAENFLLKSAE